MIGRPSRARPALSRGALALLLLVVGSGPAPVPRAIPREFQRGVCYAHVHERGYGYGSDSSRATLRRLRGLGVDWISLTPFGYQRTVHTPHVRLPRDPSLADSLLLGEMASIHALGMHALLKPHIWCGDYYDGRWSGEIGFDTDAEWRSWFDDYETFLLHFARVAEEGRAEALCVGSELSRAALEQPARFRRLIGRVRAVYHGRLTYAANWHEEFERLSFWDALDWIGVNAYFDLSASTTPTSAEIERAWAPFAEKLHRVSARCNRPVVLTEVGFRSIDHPARRTFTWREFDPDAHPNDEAQRACYEGTFRALWGRPWLAGMYWWKWYTTPVGDGRSDADFTPEGKPAEGVIREFYGARSGLRTLP